MRSVFVHLRETTEKRVAAFLQRTYPFQQGPPWICDIRGDACLYIDFCSDVRKEFEPEDWRGLLAALGGEPQISIVADISGRHPGDEQVHAFVLTLLAQFKGIAQDDYTRHCWTTEDIRSGRKVEGHSFFDYRGWFRSGQAV